MALKHITLRGVISAKWWKRKPQNLILQQRYWFNNAQTNSLNEKSRNQLRGSWNSNEHKTIHIKAGRKIHGPYSQQSFPSSAWCNREKTPSPQLLSGEAKSWNMHQMLGGSAHWIVFCLAYVRAHSRCLGDNENTSELHSLRLLQRTHGVAGRGQQR